MISTFGIERRLPKPVLPKMLLIDSTPASIFAGAAADSGSCPTPRPLTAKSLSCRVSSTREYVVLTPSGRCEAPSGSISDMNLLRCEIFPVDLDSTVAFYTDVLGFQLTRDDRGGSDPYVALTLGSVRLGAAQRPDIGDRGSRRPPAGVELVLETADLNSARARVAAAGWPVTEDVTERPWGANDFRLLDPSGYYWRVTELSSKAASV